MMLVMGHLYERACIASMGMAFWSDRARVMAGRDNDSVTVQQHQERRYGHGKGSGMDSMDDGRS